MSKLAGLRKLFKFVPKKALLAIGILTAVAVPLAVGAYGPERPTTTYPKGADHITFNSMLNNPVIGDERNFVAARVDDGSTDPNKVWDANDITVQEGKSYMVRLYVHNNAAKNLNLEAINTRVSAGMTTAMAKTATVEGFVSADNATPKKVYDYVNFNGSRNFKLSIDSDYGVHWANNGIGRTTDAKLDYNNFFNTNGALVGYSKLDGKIKGCFEYAGYVSFKVRPIFEQTSTEFSMSKQVSKNGAKAWGETYKAAPGELVDFRIDYTNVTGETQNNVTFRDALPAGMTVQSQEFWNNKTGAYQTPTGDVTTSGVNTGSVAGKGVTGRVNLTVKMPTADKLACGTNTFNNVGFVSINGGIPKEDGATVVVEKDCPKPTPVYTCDALKVNKVSRTKFDLSNTYTAKDGAIYKNTTYEVTDPNGGKTTQTTDGVYSYENTIVGKYTVVATANFDVDGADKSVTSAGCQGNFEVTADTATPVYICDLLEINKVNRTKFELSNKYTAQNGAVYKDTTYVVTDPNGGTTTQTTAGVYAYENTIVGKYTVVATTNFTVNGQTVNNTNSKCQGEFEVVSEQSTPEYKCDVLDIKKIERTKFELSNQYTAKNGAVYKDTTYVVTDPNGGKTTQTVAGAYAYENTIVGKYTVVATTNFTVNGQTVSDTNSNCEGEFTVDPDQSVNPEYVCNVLNVAKTSRTTFQFTTDYTVKNTTYLNVTYLITGANVNDTKVSTASNGGLYYNQIIPGTYTVTATLKTAAGNSTTAGCTKTFVVDPEIAPATAICKILTANKTIAKVGEEISFRVYPEYSGNVTVNSTWMDFGDGEKTSPLNIVNYVHKYTAKGNYIAKAYVNFTVDGQAQDNTTSVNCEIDPITITEDPNDKCPVKGKEHLDRDDPKCKEDMCAVEGFENLPANDPRCKRPEDKCKVKGKEYLPANDPKCVEDTIDHCKVNGKEYLPANDPKCVNDGVTNPPTTPAGPSGPSTLPATGAEMFGVVGLGSIVTSAGYFITSRKRLGRV